MAAWSIGIYAGASPLALRPAAQARNPVLTGASVTDIPAAFVADPFMLHAAGRWHMYFEAMNARTGRGEIGLATSADGLAWRYERIVLAEPFHLSFPCVFECDGEYYMVPETLAAGCVRLYRAAPFPAAWRHAADLVPGQWCDPSLFRHQGRLWMFAAAWDASAPRGSRGHTLRLFAADQVRGPWTEHPQSPVVSADLRAARPGGRVVECGGALLRFAQDGTPVYGSRVRAFEIAELTRSAYREAESAASPVLAGTGAGWNAARMHHVDAHRAPGGGWIACVDGLAA